MTALAYAIYLECLFQGFIAFQQANGIPAYSRIRYARNRWRL